LRSMETSAFQVAKMLRLEGRAVNVGPVVKLPIQMEFSSSRSHTRHPA